MTNASGADESSFRDDHVPPQELIRFVEWSEDGPRTSRGRTHVESELEKRNVD